MNVQEEGCLSRQQHVAISGRAMVDRDRGEGGQCVKGGGS